MTSPLNPTQSLIQHALRLGFSSARGIPAVPAHGFDNLKAWLGLGFGGEMHYIQDRLEAYAHPHGVLVGARSLLMLTMDYFTQPQCDPQPGEARISRYAWGTTDYHVLIHERLRSLIVATKREIPQSNARGVVDSAPLLEREYAHLAGLGWIGKHTLLMNRTQGSWFFLAALLLDVDLDYDFSPMKDFCGTCTACLDACPTQAFPQPYLLDASRCISYLTIEHRSAIPRELRAAIGDWLFGCDICQDVCPWNRKAPQSVEPAFAPLEDRNPLNVRTLFFWDEAAFATYFRQTPLWRARRRGLLRNAAIVLGNAPAKDSIAALQRGINDQETLVRGASAWGLGKHRFWPQAGTALRERLEIEGDPEVQEEIRFAMVAE